jgi:hypothetical protein
MIALIEVVFSPFLVRLWSFISDVNEADEFPPWKGSRPGKSI